MSRVLLLTTLALSFAAHANDDLARCTSIDDDNRRLACYDAAAGRAAQTTTNPQEAAASAAVLAPTPATAQAPNSAPVPTAAPEPADAVASFGAEQLPRQQQQEKGEPDRIESFLQGRFSGWNKDTTFELENGQVWQCVNCRNVYYVRERPRVVVERSFLGSYWLKVEGLNQQARVRRVK